MLLSGGSSVAPRLLNGGANAPSTVLALREGSTVCLREGGATLLGPAWRSPEMTWDGARLFAREGCRELVGELLAIGQRQRVQATAGAVGEAVAHADVARDEARRAEAMLQQDAELPATYVPLDLLVLAPASAIILGCLAVMLGSGLWQLVASWFSWPVGLSRGTHGNCNYSYTH